MHLLMCAAGSVGDVHPVLAIADAMLRRGHQVSVLANPSYAQVVQDSGARFVPIGRSEDLAAVYADQRAFTYNQGWKVWLRHAGVLPMRSLYATIRDLYVPGQTVLVGSYLTLGARVAEDHLGIPSATLHFDTHTIRSVHEILSMPAPMMVAGWLPRWFLRMEYWLADRFLIDPVVLPELNKFRRELGLASVTRVADGWWSSPRKIIGMFPEWWFPPQSDWPQHVELTAFPFWDRSGSAQSSPGLDEFLDSPEPLIVFSPGASGSHTRNYFAAASEACVKIGARGLLLTNRHELTPAQCDSHIRVERYVPFRQLLQRATAVVHHAGIGTSAQCMAAGVPQLVIPTLYNQPDVARRLERLGVARRLSSHQVTASRLVSELRQLQSSGVTTRCHEVARKFPNTDPLPRICQVLESLIPTRVVAAKRAA